MKNYFIMVVLLFSTMGLYSQNILDRSNSVKPDWISEAPSGNTYTYYTGVGTSQTSLDLAQKAALANVISFLSMEGTTRVQVTSELTKGERREVKIGSKDTYRFSENYTEVIKSDGEKITIKGLQKEEEYWQKVMENGTVVYQCWILMKTLKEGATAKKINEGYGLSPLWRSAILPGWGQLYKKEKTKGIILISATALTVGGGLLANSMYNSNINKASETHNINEINAYLEDADTWQTTRNVLFISAGAIYIYNLIDAMTSKGAKKYASHEVDKFQILPSLEEDALGLKLCMRF